MKFFWILFREEVGGDQLKSLNFPVILFSVRKRINHKCTTETGRDEVVQDLLRESEQPVKHIWGYCMNENLSGLDIEEKLGVVHILRRQNFWIFWPLPPSP